MESYHGGKRMSTMLALQPAFNEKQERANLKEEFLKTGVPEDVAEFAAQTFPIRMMGDSIISQEQRAKLDALQREALEQQKQ